MISSERMGGAWSRGHETGDTFENDDRGMTLARGLGWLSVAVGTVEAVAPRRVAAWLGVDPHWRFVQMCGVRELVNGVTILRQPHRARWLWARTAGDLLDLAALTRAHVTPDARHDRRALSGALVAGVMLFDLACGARLARGADGEV
jgi:hypothetical protein